MTASPLSGFRRLSVVAPTARVDLALAATEPLAQLLPSILREVGPEYCGDEAWLLVRPDGRTLALDRSLAGHDVRDGELLILQPGAEPVDEPLVDDVVDALTSRPGRPEAWGRVAASVAAAAGSAVWSAGVCGAPWSGWVRAACLLPAGLLLLTGLASDRLVVARSAAARGVAALVGVLGLSMTAAGAAVVPMDGGGAAHVLLGCVGGAVASAAVVASVRSRPDGSGGVRAVLGAAGMLLAALVAQGAVVVALWPHGWPGTAPGQVRGAVVTAVVALASLTWLPGLALRAAGVRRPDADDFADDGPHEHGLSAGEDDQADGSSDSTVGIVARAELAGHLFDGAVAGATLAAVTAGVLLEVAGDGWARALGLVVGAMVAVRVRLFRSPTALALSIVGAAVVLSVAAGGMAAGSGRVVVLPVAGVVAVVSLRRAVGRRPVDPRWSRWVDAAERLMLTVLVPLALVAFGAYAAVLRVGR